MINGLITVMGVPARGVEVLGVRGAEVVAVTRTDGEGRFEFAAEVDQAVARFVEPFVGVIGATAAADGTVGVAIARADIVRLSGQIVAPAGVALDWVDLRLTPRPVEVAPRIVVAVGTERAMRASYWAQRLTSATFELRLLRGPWLLWLDRQVDGPLTEAPPVNLALDHVELGGGARAEAQFGGGLLTVDRDVAVTAHLTQREEA